MDKTDRRTFLKWMGSPALAAALPLDLSRALAIPAHNRTGTIADVEHVIILMQENRSFDHYFGTMRGVRGFADPRAVKLPNGKPVWHQPHDAGQLLPFRPKVEDLGMTFLPDPPHGWTDTHAAWNGGQYDQWVPNKGVTTMTYHTRKDLPYQYALADAFTICDNYHCSLMGPTDPNRYHMWTGWVGNDGADGGPVITNDEETNAITLELSNRSSQVARVSVLNRYTSRSTNLVVWPGESESKSWSLARAGGWYDLAIAVDEDDRFEYQLAGHLETGEDSISDPIMGGLV